MERNRSKKRKAVTKDVEQEPAIIPSHDSELGLLDGTISDDESANELGYESDNSAGSDVLSFSAHSDAVSDDTKEEHTRMKQKKSKDNLSNENVNSLANFPGENGFVGEEPSFRIVKDAIGGERYIYDEIDPGDDSDYSAPDAEQNTIGNIPLSYYESYPHIGYNINGKKIMRPAKGEALDALLDSIEIPKGWTGLTDPSTGKPLELTQEELQILRQVQQDEIAGEGGYDPYQPTIEWFTSKVETMPLSSAPEPKRRFVPSKHEQKRVMKLVKAIREGRIQPYRPPEEKDTEEDEGIQNYDIWENEQPRADHAMHMPAPKLPPPGFAESYHPPPEYLPDKKEKKEWELQDEEEREKDFLPTDHSALRKVPGYERFIKERFERCLDLYLAPRVRRSKLNIDPESLLPKLPNPDDLRPFPMHETTIFRGHKGRVRSVAIDPSGQYLATGGDDGTARIWCLTDARQVWSAAFTSDEAVNAVQWRPGKESLILAVATGNYLYFCVPEIPSGVSSPTYMASGAILDAGWGYQTADSTTTISKKSITWTRPPKSLQSLGVAIQISIGHTPKTISFHPSGNHVVTIQPAPTVPAQSAICIHTISKHQTQLPFSKRLKGGGTPQAAHFHPTKPFLFVANQRVIRTYDLSKQSLIKIIQPGARWISSFSIHPTSSSVSGSDNLVVSSYDRRLLWMDLDLDTRPYKTLRYHQKAIRSVKFHPNVGRYPLFADGSDDGSIQIFHGLVTGDMMSNATIVPLKVLKGHQISSGGLGVLDLDWHPSEAWLVSAGADGTARLWTS